VQIGSAAPPRAAGVGLQMPETHAADERLGRHHDRGGDALVATLAAFVEALEQRYPGGPDELPDAGLAIDAVEANMRTVFDDEGSPAA
jgi:hypothetical protein